MHNVSLEFKVYPLSEITVYEGKAVSLTLCDLSLGSSVLIINYSRNLYFNRDKFFLSFIVIEIRTETII